jgi:AcrR family transcriptional regulator
MTNRPASAREPVPTIRNGSVPFGNMGVGILIDGAARMSKSPRAGRPRSAAADEAILEATMQLLAEVGFTGMSMEEVARRAGVGKDTLYRRYHSKEALVRGTIARMAEQEVRVPDAESLDGDLRAFLRSVVRLLTRSDFGRVVAGLVGEASRNHELGVVFRAFWAARRKVTKEVALRAGSGRPAIDVDEDLVVDLLLGPIYYRLLISGAPLSPAYIDRLVDAVIGTVVPVAGSKGKAPRGSGRSR